jgi:hypothetical protein
MFVVMQLAGGALAVGVVALLYPRVADVAEDIVVPHPSGSHEPTSGRSTGATTTE